MTAQSEAVAEVLLPLGALIADTIRDTPIRLGSAESASDLASAITTKVAVYAYEEMRPLIEALRTVHQSMTSCVGDEWAMEWLGEVWASLPLDVRAIAGDEDALAELNATPKEAS
ncbi:hypothetical protein ABZZ74_23705 [Streptomyces sp. NPDC006476]|uniref:hypothetical protein n=1 Tax=Streptomyces sp. NPDC006476 TaxID=3157175 RepID=UPI0033A8C974